MSLVQRLWRNPRLWLLSGQIASAGIGFLSLGLLARQLPQSDFGAWVLFLTNLGLIEMIRAGSVYQGLVTFIAGSPQKAEKQAFVCVGWIQSTGLTLLLMGTLHAVYWIWPTLIDEWHFTLFFKNVAVILAVTLPIQVATWIAHAHERYLPLWILSFSATLCLFGAILWDNELSLDRLYTYFIWIRIGLAVLALLWFPPWKAWRATSQVMFQTAWSRMIGYSRFTLLSTIGTNILKSADVWLINAFLGPASVALYNIPMKLLEVVEIPLRSWSMTSFPKFSAFYTQNNWAGLRYTFWKEWVVLTAGMVIGGVLAAGGAQFIIPLYAGPGFEASIPILQVFSVYLILLPLDRYLGILLDSIGKPQINTIKVFVMATLNVLGDWWVLSHDGSLVWVATVTLVHTSVGIVFGLYHLRHQLGTPYVFLQQTFRRG